MSEWKKDRLEYYRRRGLGVEELRELRGKEVGRAQILIRKEKELSKGREKGKDG